MEQIELLLTAQEKNHSMWLEYLAVESIITTVGRYNWVGATLSRNNDSERAWYLTLPHPTCHEGNLATRGSWARCQGRDPEEEKNKNNSNQQEN